MSNRYVIVPQPKPKPVAQDDAEVPVYENNVGTVPVMPKSATPDPVAAAEAETPALQATATESVTPATTETTETIGPSTEAIAPTEPEPAVTSPPRATFHSETPVEPEPVVTVSDAPAPEPEEVVVVETVAAPETDPVPLPAIEASTDPLPLDPDTGVTAPPAPEATVGSTDDGAVAAPETGGGGETATTAGGSTSGTGGAATTADGETATTSAPDTTITSSDQTTVSGETTSEPSARAPPVDEIANQPPLTETTIALTVVAPDGSAIADALVEATSDTGYQIRGRTDAAGTISLDVTQGLWTISVGGLSNLQSASQVVDTTTGSSSYALTLALSEFEVYVTGSVRDAEGEPLTGVRVDAHSENGAARADDFTITGADGSYRLGGLAGPWSITAQDLTYYYPLALESQYTPGASHGANLVVSAATTQDLTYTLMQRLLTGTLRDQNGDGVGGAAVQLDIYSHDLEFHFSQTVITSVDGLYLSAVPWDAIRVDVRPQVQPAGYGDIDREFTTWQLPSPDDGMTIAIPDFHYYKFSTSASGVVRNELGTTVAGYVVAAEFFSVARAKTFWIEAATDATGTWTIAGDPGEWSIYPLTSITGYSAAAVTGLLVGAAGLSGAEVVLVAGAAVTGTVTFQDSGAPAAGVGVKVCGFTCSYTKTNSLGEYVAWLAVNPQTRSSNGTVQMLTAKTGYARSTAAVSGATTGSVFMRDVDYVPFSTAYSGIVTDVYGTPVPGAVVHLSDGDDEALVYVLADGTWSGLGPAIEAFVSATGVYPTSGNSQIFVASAGTNDLVLLLPAIRLAGTAADQGGNPLGGLTVDAERWLCAFGAEHCDWADLFGSFYGEKLATISSAVTDALGKYELTLDPGLFSDNFPLRLAPQGLAGYVSPGRVTPSYLPGQVTFTDFEYLRASIEIQGVADGAVYAHAVTPVVVTTDGFDVEVTLNGLLWTPGEISADGAYTIVARALRSGAEAARAAVLFAIDTVAPTVTVDGVANGGVYAAPVTPVITVTDPNLAVTIVTLDGEPFAGGAIETEGRHVLVVSAGDWAANSASATMAFVIDLTAPVTTLTTAPADGPFGDDSLFTLTATDGDGSGVAATYWSLDGAAASLYSAPFSLTGLTGSHVLSWFSTDVAGNVEATTSATLEFAAPVQQADLVLSKTVAPSIIVIGGQAVYRFDVRNDGPQTALNVVFVDHIGAGVDFVAIDLAITTFESCSWSAAGRTVTCSAASLAPGATASGGFHFRAIALGTLTNTANVTSATVDPNAANNSDTATLEVVPPAPSRPDLLAADDSGLSNVDNVTFVNRPRFSVTTAPGLLVELVEAGAVLGSALANSVGVAIVQVGLALADGLHAISARARVDALSTPSGLSTALSVRIDTIAPIAPVLALRAGEDSGLSSTDNVTNVALWHIYAALGDAVQVPTHEIAPNGREVDYAAVPAFVFLPDEGGGLGADNRQGTWTYQAVGVDLAGNRSAPSNVLAITFDSIAPAAPVLDVPAHEDSGASNTDNVTNVGTLHIYAQVDDAVSLPTTAIAPDGTTVTSTAAPGGAVFPTQQGKWKYEAFGIDLAGNRSAPSNVLEVTFDSIAPAAPSRPDLPAAADSGVFGDDDITNVSRPSFDATLEAGAVITIYVDGSPYSGATPLADGAHSVTAKAADLAGNVSAASEALTVTIDTTTPVGTLLLNGGAAGTRDPGVHAVPSFADVLGAFQLRFSTDGGATWSDWMPYASDLSVALPGADGVKTVVVEVRDRAGNVGSASDDIRLDRLGPVLAITSPAAGAVYDVVQIVAIAFTADDPSGIASTTVTLDGSPVSGSSLDTFLLTVGSHTLVVSVVDTVGNVSTKTVTFEVRATVDGLSQAIRRAMAAGLIERGEGRNLLQRLEDVARELARGDERDAAKKLRQFAEDILDEAGDKINAAFARRAADWAFDLASRLFPRALKKKR